MNARSVCINCADYADGWEVEGGKFLCFDCATAEMLPEGRPEFNQNIQLKIRGRVATILYSLSFADWREIEKIVCYSDAPEHIKSIVALVREDLESVNA